MSDSRFKSKEKANLFNKTFSDLVERVSKIDEDAAKYLVANKDSYTSRYGRISALFIWSETPQGVSYWGNISKQLGEDI